MIDQDTRAANAFYRLVRTFSESAKPWDGNVIFYETKPDEMWDLSLVARRVYGDREEFLAVAAAAAIDTFDQPLTARTIALPNRATLNKMKREAGFESKASLRENGAPVWRED